MAGDDFLNGNSGLDTVFGGDGEDTLRGGIGNDFLIGDAGDDFLHGDSGHDRLDGGLGIDTAFGGSGNDRILGFAGADKLVGDAGNDAIFGGNDGDSIRGLSNDDGLFGEAGNDNIDGGTGNDKIYGGIDEDRILGGAGNDIVYGGDGNDAARGGTGNDILYGGNGTDTLRGDEGVDVLFGESGIDFLDGGDGNDKIYGGIGDDHIVGGAGNDNLYGGDGNDIIRGRTGDDLLSGGNGNDQLFGDEGDDTLLGGAGDDILSGGTGRNVLDGGGGTDTLRFSGDASEYDYAIVNGQLVITHARGTQADGVSVLAGDFENVDFKDAALGPTDVGILAGDDARTTTESAAFTSDSVLANDFDRQVLEGTETLAVSAVNGSGANVGTQITLPSGALLTMNANGTFSYDPNGAFNSLGIGQEATDSFDYTVTDGNGHTDIATVSVRITGENVAPTLTAGAVSGINVLNLLTGIIDPTITITDPDDTNMEGARVSITSGLQSGDELLFTDQNGITGSFDASTGVLTLSGTASIAQYETALESVVFEAGGILGLPVGLGVRTVGFEVNDGDVFSVPSPSSTASVNVFL
ncbi:MAG: Ig-like domain-containing protein [Hyphomicrobium sp.]